MALTVPTEPLPEGHPAFLLQGICLSHKDTMALWTPSKLLGGSVHSASFYFSNSSGSVELAESKGLGKRQC